jgi:hypothetical protein
VFRYFYENYPWIYSPKHGWLLDYQAGVISDNLFLFSANLGPLWVTESYGGWFWIYNESRWESF